MSPVEPDETRTLAGDVPSDPVTAGETLPPPTDLRLPPDQAAASETLAPPADFHLPPEDIHVPGFEIVGMLGRGGMGVVYRARQAALNRIVALKMILAGPGITATERHRFLVEAEAVAAIQHSNVVGVYAFGDDGGRPFLALEYLPGGSLVARIRDRGRLTPAEAADLVAKIARGTQAAHAMGIVHRDLKSANVLFDAVGEPKVTDFGLAKRSGSSDLTRTGAVMGTPAYMAPEQAKGGGKFVGPAVDIWALGVILYECLTGTVPFRGDDTWSVLAQVMADDPVPPRKAAPGIPQDLDVICLKCLAKEPAERYTTAKALADDLDRYLAGETIEARAVSRTERLVRWVRRKPAQAGLAIAAVLLLSIGGVAAAMWSLWREADNQHTQAMKFLGEMTEEQTRTVNALARETLAVRAATEANEKLEYVTALNQVVLAHHDWEAGDVAAALQGLDAVSPAKREWEWFIVEKLCHGETRAIRFLPDERPTSVTVSPNGKYAAVTVDLMKVLDPGEGPVVIRSDMKVIELETGRAVSLASQRAVPQIAFDPSGNWIRSTGSLWFLNWAELKSAAAIPADKILRGCEFDPIVPGRVYALNYAEPVTTWQLTDGEPPRQVPTSILPADLGKPKTQILWLRLSADGHRAVAATQWALHAWDPSKPSSVVHAGFPADPAGSRDFPDEYRQPIELSPNGKYLGYTKPDGGLALWRTADLTPVPWPATQAATVAAFAFNGKDRVLTIGHSDTDVRVADLETGATVAVIRGHTAAVAGVGVRRSTGEVVTVSADQTLRIWPPPNVTEPGSVRFLDPATPDPPAGRPVNPSWTTDLTRFGFWNPSDGLYRVWDTATGRPALSPVAWDDLTKPTLGTPDEPRLRISTAAHTLLGSDGNMTFPVVVKPRTENGFVRVFRYRLPAREPDGPPKDVPLADPFGISPRLSADGTRLAVETYREKPTGSMNSAPPPGEQSAVRVYDVATGRELFSTGRLDRWLSRVHFTSDGRCVVVLFLDHSVRCWNVDTGVEAFPVRALAATTDEIDLPTVSPDGSYVAFVTRDRGTQQIHVTHLDTGRTHTWPAVHTGPVQGLTFRPDNGRLLSFGTDRRVKLWDVGTGTASLSLLQPDVVVAAGFSADGRKVLIWRMPTQGPTSATVYEAGPQRK
jgi:WD40 repeat protein